MKHLKLFETSAAYNAATLDLPNVSLIEENMSVSYNPYVYETKLVVYYDIQDISNPTTICTNYDDSLKSMEIDGVDNVDIDTQGNISYQFDSVGEHVIKYELNGLGVGINAPLFYNVSTVKMVIIPNTFTSIGGNAFNGCSGLTSIDIPNSVTSIGDQGFYGCSSLTSVTIPNSVTSINVNTFYNCTGLTSIDIPSGVTSIGDSAFRNCRDLTSIDIPDSVTSIGGNTFSYCSGLTSIVIPDSVTSIGYSAFYNCSSLTTCTIGSSVTIIDYDIFYGCSSLTSIVCNGITAPNITSTTFRNVNTGGTLTVPAGSTGYDTWISTDNFYLGKYNWTMIEQ